LLLVASSFLTSLAAALQYPGLPTSAQAMVERATKSCLAARDAGKMRLTLNLVVPLLPTVRPEDIDPWPGGLNQQFPTVERLTQQILRGIAYNGAAAAAAAAAAAGDGGGGGVSGSSSSSSSSGAAKPCSTQVLSSEDACALLIQEGPAPALDCAAVVFPGVDQLQDLKRVDSMVTGRLLLIVNPQFRRVEDFGFWRKQEAEAAVFARFEQGFSFEEFSCRGEQVKLTYDFPTGWRSFAALDEAPMARTSGSPPLSLHDDPLPERPEYEFLTQRINKLIPDFAWKRGMEKK